MLTKTEWRHPDELSREEGRPERFEGFSEYRTYHEELWKTEQRRVYADRDAIGYDYVQAFINNISFPKSLAELEYYATEHGCFNVEDVLNEDTTIWTAPRWAKINDVVFFMHTKTAISTITRLRTELNQNRATYSNDRFCLLSEWINRGIQLYKSYGGKIFAIGRVSAAPEYTEFDEEDSVDYQYHWKSRIMAEISDIAVLETPIDISEFNDFIRVSRQSGITPVLGKEFTLLREVIRRKNSIPEYFARSVSSAIPLYKITRDNWLSIPKEYRRRFVLEAQFRSFFVDYLLAEIGDRRTFFKECRCKKSGIPDSFVDNLIFINGKWLPVEVKLSIATQQNLNGQVAKYCYDDMIIANNRGKDRIFEPHLLFGNRVLVIDTDSVFLYNADDDTIKAIVDLDSISDRKSLSALKAHIVSAL